MIKKFARPYARALLDTASSIEAAVEAQQQLERFAGAMQMVPRLGSMAANPAIPLDVKHQAVAEVAGALQIDSLARRFLRMLVDNYRLPQLPAILDAIDELLKKKQGILTGTVHTATPLSEEHRARLEQVLEDGLHGQIDLKVEVDPKLMAGFVAQIGSQRFDASMAGQLERMAREMAAVSE